MNHSQRVHFEFDSGLTALEFTRHLPGGCHSLYGNVVRVDAAGFDSIEEAWRCSIVELGGGAKWLNGDFWMTEI